MSKHQKAAKAVAKRAIVIRSAHNDRTSTGSRITEPDRQAIQSSAKAALRKLYASSEQGSFT
jgi:hypothetical protein